MYLQNAEVIALIRFMGCAISIHNYGGFSGLG
jgi:hypothetical protein